MSQGDLMRRDYEAEIAENVRLLRLIHDDDGWALARVKRAAGLEAEVERLTANHQGAVSENEELRDLLREARKFLGIAVPGSLAWAIDQKLFPPAGGRSE